LNYGEAYKWFTLAGQGGLTESKRALKELSQIITKTQLRDGQARVSDWVSHHNDPALSAQKAEAGVLNSYVSTRP
jgi:hypothetical protein